MTADDTAISRSDRPCDHPRMKQQHRAPPQRGPARSLIPPALLALAGLVTALGACTPEPARSVAPVEVTVTGSGPVALAVGQVLVVTLAANPSTGYGWAVERAADAAVLVQRGDFAYQPAAAEGRNMPGAGGHQTLRFAAVASGVTTVQLGYRRPWETGVAPVETVTLEVTVTPGGGR
jgi:inhibitor of cysteine peptidase